MNILKLERRGCNFFNGDTVCELSDIGNYRVGSYDYSIKGKDGRSYILDLSHYERYQYRKTHKITGRPLKHPVRELVNDNAVHLSTQYEEQNENGFTMSYCKIALEAEIREFNLSYTKADILKLVNYISEIEYTDIEIV